MTRLTGHGALLALVALLGASGVGGDAFAGTYEVKFCDGIGASATPASPDGRGFAFSVSNEAMYNSPVRCPTNAAFDGGMAQRNTLNKGRAPFFSTAAATFRAPPGAVVRTLKWRGIMHRSECHWTVGVGARGTLVGGLRANRDCAVTGFDLPAELTYEINAGIFNVGVACGNLDGCGTSDDSSAPPPGARALMRTYSARITVEDFAPPEFANAGGGIAGGQWLRGSQALTSSPLLCAASTMGASCRATISSWRCSAAETYRSRPAAS